MKTTLVNKFRELGIIQYETKVHATVNAKGIGYEKVRINKELVLQRVEDAGCSGISPRDPHITYTITYGDIHRIDGMNIERLAQSYDLNIDGTPRAVGLKPGRKPKTDV